MKAEGVGPAEIAKKLGVGRASVYRVLAITGAPEPIAEAAD
jgi:DNA-binding phage protein